MRGVRWSPLSTRTPRTRQHQLWTAILDKVVVTDEWQVCYELHLTTTRRLYRGAQDSNDPIIWMSRSVWWRCLSTASRRRRVDVASLRCRLKWQHMSWFHQCYHTTETSVSGDTPVNFCDSWIRTTWRNRRKQYTTLQAGRWRTTQLEHGRVLVFTCVMKYHILCSL